MSLYDWVRNTSRRVRTDGVSGIAESAHLVYKGGWRICGSRLPLGTNVYDREWDLLVLLDGCRVDTLTSVVEERSTAIESDVGRLRSVGSTSREWLAKTFSPAYRDEIARTVYVTANPYSEEILGTDGASANRSPFNPANWSTLALDDFAAVEEVWREGWDEELGTTPPRAVTDRAISTAREREPERLIVHYMQPHQPFIGEQALATENGWKDENCWVALHRGEASVDTVRDAYRENLRVVLEDVELLLQNINADRAVISADHGNAFGAWGIYGHPNGFLHPSVKHVPWATTQAEDEETHRPTEPARTGVETSTEERLQNLGYL